MMPRRKTCHFCESKVTIDYKDEHQLDRFTNDRGKILPRRVGHVRASPETALAGHQAGTVPGAHPVHPRPPAIASSEPTSRGWGLAEWTVALTLLFASLPGPWLTLGLPAGLLFALFDRRLGARVVGVVVVALVAA